MASQAEDGRGDYKVGSEQRHGEGQCPPERRADEQGFSNSWAAYEGSRGVCEPLVQTLATQVSVRALGVHPTQISRLSFAEAHNPWRYGVRAPWRRQRRQRRRPLFGPVTDPMVAGRRVRDAWAEHMFETGVQDQLGVDLPMMGRRRPVADVLEGATLWLRPKTPMGMPGMTITDATKRRMIAGHICTTMTTLSATATGEHARRADETAASGANLVKDPVCGMVVDPHTTKHRVQYAGRPYYFCSAGCQSKFMADPAPYADREKPKAEEVPEGTIYTCPMHPEIRQVGPGSCPICGMALEPVLVTADAAPNPELADMTCRFWIGLVLTLPVFALEMGGHLVGLDHWIPRSTSNWIQMASRGPSAAVRRSSALPTKSRATSSRP